MQLSPELQGGLDGVNIWATLQTIHGNKVCISNLGRKFSGMKIRTRNNICKLPITGQNGDEVKQVNGCGVIRDEQ